MFLGIVSSQQLDIKEIKIGLITVEEQLDTMSQRIESGFETVGKRLETLEGRIEIQEKKFDPTFRSLKNDFSDINNCL